MGGATRTHLLADPKRAKDWFYPGLMYLFVYDPKHKKTLPYYDKFPLVFPIEFYDDGFLGLNFHYLDYRSRLMLFHQMLAFVEGTPGTKKARIEMAYRTLKAMSGLKVFKPCVKRYLSQHVMSQAIRIEGPDWETALFLPVENFAKKSKTAVWNESMKIASGEQSGPTGLPSGSHKTPTVAKTVSTNGLPRKN